MRGRAAGLLVVALLALTACDDGATEGLTVMAAWSRPSPPGAVDGVVYFTLTSDVADSVVSVATDPQVARSTELHESMLSGSGSGHQHGGGATSDGEPTGFVVGPGQPLVLEPGGRHVMLVGLDAPLEEGHDFAIIVTLASGRVVRGPVVVADNPPSG